MDKKKILISIDWFLPGTNSGGPVRSYINMIHHLGSYHDFYIMTRDTDYCSDVVYPTVKSNAWNQIDAHTNVYYFSNDQLNIKNITKVITEYDFDVVYINGMYSWYFSIIPLWLMRAQKNVIIAARGMLNTQAFSVKKRKKQFFLKIANWLKLYKNVTFHATNEDESKQIDKHIDYYNNILIAPNLPRKNEGENIEKKKLSEVTTFVNIARISIEKGTLKMIEAFTNVDRTVQLDIYGQIYDEDYWNRCQSVMEKLPAHVDIKYKGVLPSEDVLQTLTKYNYFILLSEGENFGHAILEGLMAGCPVIISENTPWKNLEQKKIGWDVSTELPENIANTIEQASTMSGEDYQIWSQNAIKFSKEFSNNPELIRLNLALFSELK